MKLVPVQQVMQRRFERQARIKDIETHASGHCVHIGKISPGCVQCFVPGVMSENFHLGTVCNATCTYCFGTGKGRDDPPQERQLQHKAVLMHAMLNADLSEHYPIISFTGGGEPLLYMDSIEYYMSLYRGIDMHLARRPWYYLYTNGIAATQEKILRLKELGFNEMRFHVGASGFSQRVYDNMAFAAEHIEVITVETPAWPLHRDKLFEMLPIIEQIGVKHLNLGEIAITHENEAAVRAALPDADVYQNYYVHLDDGGLVYDLMDEVVAQGYSYSVLDCGSFVKAMQQSPGKHFMHEPVDGMCTDYTGLPDETPHPAAQPAHV